MEKYLLRFYFTFGGWLAGVAGGEDRQSSDETDED